MEVISKDYVFRALEAVASSEIQLLLIALSIIVLIAVLLFAGYVLIRNNRNASPEVQSGKAKAHSDTGDGDNWHKRNSEHPVNDYDKLSSPPVTDYDAVSPRVSSGNTTAHLEKGDLKVGSPDQTEVGDNWQKRNSGQPVEDYDKQGSLPAKKYNPSLRVPSEKTITPLKISNLKIDPHEPKIGELVNIQFSATNLDRAQIGHQVILKINDQILNIRQVSILPGTILHLNFKVSILEPGSYVADINGTQGTFTISG